MKKCAQALRFICDNLDAEMNSRRCIEIRRHLAGCPDCTAYLDSMKKTVAMYRQYPADAVPPAVHRLLAQSLKKERGKSEKNFTRPHR